MISITTLDADLARRMEPRTSAPHARLRAVERLRAAGVSVGVMAAPIIPALNDVEIPAILRAAAEAGAQGASYTLLRLPLTVRPVFLEWLERCEPLAKERVTSRILDVRGGKLNQSQFGRRMRGEGEIAEQIRRTFEVFAKRYRLDGKLPPLETSLFKPPRASSGQLRMF
jgi:DNA repair photolyase